MFNFRRHGKPVVMSEAQEQTFLVAWARTKKIPIVHIPNERKCSPQQGAMLKRMGVAAGFPDLFIPIAKHGFHGLFIEMKRTTSSCVSKFQREWLKLLGDQGYFAVVCFGYKDAQKVVEGYLREN